MWIGNIHQLFVQEGPLQFTRSRTVVASRRSFGGAMFANTGSHLNCVDFTVPEINRIVLFSGLHTTQPHRSTVFSSQIDK
jgi:hypothetical protein